MTPEKKVEPAPLVPPFVRFVASAIPMVFDDSLSYYECLAALTKYMQDVADVVNNNGAVTEEYIALTKELKEYVENYFENLDVQEEINNKLDEMTEAGTLQEIITAYIQANVAWCFNTVADMKNATNLIAGSYAQTLGFNSLNDGGGAIYKISDTGTANEMNIIAVGDLYANLIYGDKINIKQLGAKADDTNDDSGIINHALTLSKSIYIPKGTYLLSSSININGSISDHYKFKCDGILHTTATNGLVIKGNYNVVEIDSILGNGSNNLVLLTTDSTYTTTGYNNLDIKQVKSCLNGFVFKPTQGGILYNEIHFMNIYASNACILFQCDDVNRSYVSENHFYGGRCGNGTGVKMVKGEAQTDRYDGNLFEHIGFEGLSCGASLEFASNNNFSHCRTSESLTGDYWFVCASNTIYNKFNVEVIDIGKINDSNAENRGYNEYEATHLLINGVASGTKVRIYKNKYIFADKFDYYKYTSYTDLYNTTSGEMTADYYYNGMVFRVGSDNEANIVLRMSDGFRQCGITNFYLFMKNLGSTSSFKIRNQTDTTDVIKASNFTGGAVNTMYHVEYTPGVSTFGSDWSITSSYKLP